MKTDEISLNSIIVAALLVATSALFYNASPVIVGAAFNQLQFSDEQLGLFMVPGMIALTLVSLLLTKRVRVWNWKKVLIWGGALQIVGFCLASVIESFNLLLFSTFIIGIGAGLCYSIAMVCIGDAENPDRGFGIAAICQSIFATIALYFVPVWIAPIWGFSGVMLIFSIFGGFAILASQLFPKHGRALRQDNSTKIKTEAITVENKSFQWLSVIALFTFIVGISIVWTFYERYGIELGFDAKFIGEVLSVGHIISGFGAFVPAIIGNRYGRVIPIALTCWVLIISIGFLYFANTPNRFWVTTIAFELCWAVALPYFFSVIASQDSKGKIVVMIPAIYGLATAVGTGLSGYLFATGAEYPLIVSIGFLITSIVIQVILGNKAKRSIKSVPQLN